MIKRIFIFVMILMLSFGTSQSVYASNSNIGQLDNQGETESTAGITWDQINEMSQNSPNSLTPIQGLVLWMFAILAFLKLAQKMDSLLQSLGLNVTQTGGRAVGDLIMAGMALRHVGSAFSKGMGMLGLGKGGGSGGGAPGASASTGTRGAGGSPVPIPTGSSSSGPTPAGGSPSGSSPSGRTSTSGAPTGGSPTGSPAAGTPHGSSASPSSPTTGAASSGTPTASRSPFGKAAEWMSQDGKAQRAIKTAGNISVIGVKGGAIGLGVAGAKFGAAKIGSAVSARFGSNSISTDSHAEDSSNTSQHSQQPVDSNINGSDNTHNAINHDNSEYYQTSKPFDGGADQVIIPSSINSEDYQDSKYPDGTDGSDTTISSNNDDEEYNAVGSHDTVAAAQPISASINGQESSIKQSNHEPISPSADTNNETWQAAKPSDGVNGATPAPTPINSEGWHGSTPSDKSSTPITATHAETATVVMSSNSSVVQHGGVTNIESSGGALGGSSDGGSGHIISQDSSGGDYNDSSGYEIESVPVHSHAISSDVPQSGTQPNIAYDKPLGSNAGVDTSSHDGVHSAQPQVMTETIHTDALSATQPQSVDTIVGGSASSVQTDTLMQSQTTQVNNLVAHDTINPAQSVAQTVVLDKQGYGTQPAVQPSATRNNTTARPKSKGKPKNPSVKGRKRRR